MMGDKVIAMGLALVVSIFVARYLGPEQYGILSYALSLSSLFAVATHMGLSGLAVRELVNYPDEHRELMGTIFGIKAIAAILAVIAYMGFIFFTSADYDVEFWVLVLVSGTIVIKPFKVFDHWFKAKVKAKYSSIVSISATLILSVLKILLVFLAAHLIAFAAVYLLQAILIAGLLIYFFRREANFSILEWKFNFKRTKELLAQGWMIMLGAFFAIFYLKIDQVMLRLISGAEEVGIYAVAAKLSEAWYFIPGVIVTSLFPKLLELKERNDQLFKKRLQQLFDLLYSIALTIAIIVTFVAGPVIIFLYGPEFSEASVILSIHIWAGVFIFMRAVFSKWILVEDAIPFSMITQGTGALVNVLLNLVFIPLYGGIGAAIATILSYSMASYFALFFYKKSRKIFWMMTKSLFAPFLMPYNYFKK